MILSRFSSGKHIYIYTHAHTYICVYIYGQVVISAVLITWSFLGFDVVFSHFPYVMSSSAFKYSLLEVVTLLVNTRLLSVV